MYLVTDGFCHLYSSVYVQDIDVIATYSDVSGAVRISRVKMSHLSASWILENPSDRDNGLPNSSQVLKS